MHFPIDGVGVTSPEYKRYKKERMMPPRFTLESSYVPFMSFTKYVIRAVWHVIMHFCTFRE